MGRIITYKNEGGYCFSQIEFDNGERVLISVLTEEFNVKIFEFLNGTTPVRTIFSMDLSKATDIFLKREDWDKKRGIILDNIIEAIRDSKSIQNMNEKLDYLVASKK